MWRCDYGLLESAVARPRTTVFGADSSPTVVEEAAAPLESLVGNHAFLEGNKRLDWLATATFLYLNGYGTDNDDAKSDLVVAVTEGSVSGVEKIANACDR